MLLGQITAQVYNKHPYAAYAGAFLIYHGNINPHAKVIYLIFTHLKLCLATATHNFKWLKIICFLLSQIFHV